MRLSWNEIRARAAAFSREWHDAAYETADTQSFYNEFLAASFVIHSTIVTPSGPSPIARNLLHAQTLP